MRTGMTQQQAHGFFFRVLDGHREGTSVDLMQESNVNGEDNLHPCRDGGNESTPRRRLEVTRGL
ncbi:MAG: hypothetical protein AAEJ46_00635 [Planctomycetota bacterium]